jgi:hypothetical protein
MIHDEADRYMQIDAEAIRTVAEKLFRKENCNQILYLKK